MSKPPTTIRVFASHDWGKDNRNHKKVSIVVDALRGRGIDVWFDETHMKGNILDSMCKGIDDSDVVLIFVTQNYISKVESGGDADNVRREFMYASKNPKKLLAIRFDSHLVSNWPGPVGMVLGSHLYTDLTTIHDKTIDNLFHSIRTQTGSTMWKNATRKIIGAMPISTKKDADAKNIRSRIKRVILEMGEEKKEDEHSGDIINRLLVSMIVHSDPSLPMHEKLCLLEREIGIK